MKFRNTQVVIVIYSLICHQARKTQLFLSFFIYAKLTTKFWSPQKAVQKLVTTIFIEPLQAVTSRKFGPCSHAINLYAQARTFWPTDLACCLRSDTFFVLYRITGGIEADTLDPEQHALPGNALCEIVINC